MDIEVNEKSFNCGQDAALLLSNIRGKVGIQAGDDGVIKIRAEKILNSGDAENTVIELSQDNEGRVVASTRYDQYGIRFFRRNVPCKVNYEVSVPRNCALKIRGVSNTASIAGISGQLDISSVSGDLELKSLNGELKIKSVSGDVQGESVSGSTTIDTVSGDLYLKNSNFPSLRAKTVSGDLTFETPLGDGPYDFNSVSGDIKIEATRLIGLTVDSSSLSGDLRTTIPLTSSNYSRTHQSVEVMGGGVAVRHKSVSGDFFLDSAGEIEESTALPSLKDDQVEEISRREILTKIEQGELSVDEAVGIIERIN